MNSFEKEMRKFFATDKLIEDKVYFGATLTGRLNDTTNVKVYFDTQMVADKYCGFTVMIINKTSGVVDRVYIKFSDILGTITVGPNKMSIHLWKDREDVSWYCHTPTAKEIKDVMTVVSNYIKLYK